MSCKNCVKEDVCKQKELLDKIKDLINDIRLCEETENTIRPINKKELNLKYGIEINIVCTKAVKKQTEFSPGWTNADTKKL